MTDRIKLQQLSRHWTPPGGLDRSRPREVMLTPGGRALAAFSVAMLACSLAAVAGLDLIAERERRTARLFEVKGRDAGAEVTRLWRERGKDHQPWIAFRFRVGDRDFESQAPARYRIWRNLRIGSALTVRFLPSDPRVVRLRDNPPQPMPAFIPILVGLGLLAAGVVPPLVIGGQRRLLSEGRPALALVTRHSRSQHGRTVVHYEFATLGGTIAMGRSEARKP
ncbi:MAG: DUF3592 domain-containing protein, partial [Vicinamibacteria bacterium]|nr:DUF3592 domain-containing protein [Vicinamibacteria bacterium]